MKYEMRIPPGVTIRQMTDAISKYNLELKHGEHGPILYGKKEDLEKARDYFVKSLKERIKELEDR